MEKRQVVVRIFDPPMCCSTGVCGPAVDHTLIQFAADLEWLAEQGVQVERFNLAQQPGKFVERAAVRSILDEMGERGLPVVEVGQAVKSVGVYPSRQELSIWSGLERQAEGSVADNADTRRSPCCAPPVDGDSGSGEGTCC